MLEVCRFFLHMNSISVILNHFLQPNLNRLFHIYTWAPIPAVVRCCRLHRYFITQSSASSWVPRPLRTNASWNTIFLRRFQGLPRNLSPSVLDIHSLSNVHYFSLESPISTISCPIILLFHSFTLHTPIVIISLSCIIFTLSFFTLPSLLFHSFTLFCPSFTQSFCHSSHSHPHSSLFHSFTPSCPIFTLSLFHSSHIHLHSLIISFFPVPLSLSLRHSSHSHLYPFILLLFPAPLSLCHSLFHSFHFPTRPGHFLPFFHLSLISGFARKYLPSFLPTLTQVSLLLKAFSPLPAGVHPTLTCF